MNRNHQKPSAMKTCIAAIAIATGITAGALTLFAGKAEAAGGNLSPTQYRISAGALACVSERAYDDQMSALAQGYTRTIQGCGIASVPIDVIVIEMNVMSASKVRAVKNGAYLWVGMDGLESE